MKNKIVLAYSGGLDTSVILKWLQTEYNADVIAYAADLGQGAELTEAKIKAKKLGAKKIYIENLKEEKFSNMVIYNNKDDKRKTKILYSGKKFGYSYNGEYEITVKSPTCALIQYENNFVLNKTILERIDDDSIKITIELDTSYPIPERLLRLMIRQKLYYLR